MALSSKTERALAAVVGVSDSGSAVPAAVASPPHRLVLATFRPRQWAHFCLLPLASVDFRAADALAEGARLGRGIAIAALSLAFAYGLNAVTDRAGDLDRRKNPLAGVTSPPPFVLPAVGLTAAAALALAATGGAWPFVATLISIAASALYSAGPRAKAVPLLGTLINVPIFAPLLGLAYGGGARPPAFDVVVAAFVALLLQNQLLHEGADADEDAGAGVRTTARVLGDRGTRIAVVALGVAGAALSAALASGALSLVAAACVAAPALVAAPSVNAGDTPAPRAPFAWRRLTHRAAALAAGACIFGCAWALS